MEWLADVVILILLAVLIGGVTWFAQRAIAKAPFIVSPWNMVLSWLVWLIGGLCMLAFVIVPLFKILSALIRAIL